MLPHDQSSLFPVFYRKLTDIRVVSPLVHLGFLSTRKTLARRLREQSSEIVGWETLNKAAYNWYWESTCRCVREQCRKMVQRCGYRWKRRLLNIERNDPRKAAPSEKRDGNDIL
jgi:hypothetical protein